MSIVQAGVRAVLETAIGLSPIINACLGMVIFAYIVHRLLCCSEQYNRSERLGMSMVAAGILIATPALWIANTPFDNWSFNVARIGVTLYIITGGMRRDRHARRNALAAAEAELHLRGRGRL